MHRSFGRTILFVVIFLGLSLNFRVTFPAASQQNGQTQPPETPEVYLGAASNPGDQPNTPTLSSENSGISNQNVGTSNGIDSISADIQFTTVPNSKPSWGGTGMPVDGCTAVISNGDTVTFIIGDANSTSPARPVGFWGYNHRANVWYQPAAANTPADRWAPDWAYDAETNRCYLTGGATIPGPGNLKNAYMFNPITNTFSALPDFTTVRDFHDSWIGTVDGVKRLCIGGGVNSNTMIGLTSTQCYDITLNTWTPENAIIPPYPVKSWGAADGVFNGSQFWTVAGIQGEGIISSDAAWYFDDADNQWHSAGNTGVARYRVEGDFFDGRFYLMGGSPSGFSPITGVRIGQKSGSGWIWYAGPPLINARMDLVANAGAGKLWSVDGYGSTSTNHVDKLDYIPSHWNIKPDSLKSNQYPDVQVTQHLTVTNSGYLPLEWSINAILWDQPVSSTFTNAYVNQEFGANDSLNAYLVDDFANTVPWKLSRIFVPGNFWNGGSTLLNATMLHWLIFRDDGGKPNGYPGGGAAPFWTLDLPPTNAQVSVTKGTDGLPGNTTLNLLTPVNLPPGHYWLFFYPSMTFSQGGQYGRQLSDTKNGEIAQFINPQGGWGCGTSWKNWNVIAPTATQTDLAFRLEGAVQGNVPWLSVDPTSNEITGNSSQAIAITYHSNGLAVGKYFARLEIAVKDNLTPEITIPIELNIVPAITASPSALKLGLEPGESGSTTIRVANSGYTTFPMVSHEIPGIYTPGLLNILNLNGETLPGTIPTEHLTKNPAYDPNSPTSMGLYLDDESSGYAPTSIGGVLLTWWHTDLSSPWGIGIHGNLWISDLIIKKHIEFGPLGAPTGKSSSVPWSTSWMADMAYDSKHGQMCVLNVGGDNGIHCWNPVTGAETNSITGSFAWNATSQRGLAYRPEDDSFYLGGWNTHIVYHIQGFSSATPGAVIGQCNPPDGAISGLAYNPVTGVLWESTSSPTDTIYKLNPATCASLGSIPFPAPGYHGAGLEMDPVGNLWAVDQILKRVYLIDSEMPTYSEVPWLSESPITSTVAAKSTQSVTVNYSSNGLTPGTYTGSLVFESDDQNGIPVAVPITLTIGSHSMEVTPVSLSAELGQGLKKSLQLTLKNVGTANKYFSVTHNAGWLSEDPVSAQVVPNGSYAVNITLNSTGLAPGVYTSNLVIQTDDPVRPEFQIPVTLTVKARVYLPAIIKP